MHNRNVPSDTELPSTEKLVKSTVAAAIVAVILLLIAVLPAEYGVDPTGIGEALGLRRMGEVKVSLAQEAAAGYVQEMSRVQQLAPSLVEPGSAPEVGRAEAILSHEMVVELAPNEGTEIKVVMEKGSKVRYKWWSNGGRANFDVHGDSQELKINYHSYSKGSEEKSEGVIEAAFDGSHGWFWRNRTSKTMAITLQTSGEYTAIKRLE